MAEELKLRRRAESQGAVPLAAAVLLTWIAGFVDAVGFLAFARIYTANMSGNSVAVGIFLSARQWPQFMLRLWPIVIYVVGLVLGRGLIEIGAARKQRRIASVAFGCEVVLLGIVASGIEDAQYVGIALLAAAMGIQNAALTKFSSLDLHTGFVTGTLVKFSEQFVGYVTGLVRLLGRGESIADSFRHESFRMSLFLGLTWTAYVVGAAAGGWGKAAIETRAVVVPIIGLALLILLDVFRPLGVQEEQQQQRIA